MKNRILPIYFLTQILLLSAGCPSSCGKKSGGAQAMSQPANGPNTLTIGIAQEPDSLFLPFKEMMASEEVARAGNYTLTIFDDQWHLVPFAAKEIPTLENGKLELFKDHGINKMRATWEIRDEFFWPDGTPLTADDFVFAQEINSNPMLEVVDRSVTDKIEKMEAKGPHHKTLVVTWKEPYAYYHNYRQHEALPKHLLEAAYRAAPKDMRNHPYGTAPALAGPFTIKEWVPGSHIIAVRNTKVKGFLIPALDKIIWKIIPQTNTLEANLVSGEIDAISPLGLSIEQATQFAQRHGNEFDIHYAHGLVWEHVDYNLDNPILKDKRVRQALVYGADRAGISKALFFGKGVVADATYPPKSAFYNPNVKRYPYDVAAANKLLDEAGWKQSAPGAIRTKDGKPLELTLMTTSGTKDRESVSQLLQSQWKMIGVDLQIKTQPAKVFFGDTLRKRKFTDMAMYAWVNDPIAAADTLWRCDYIPKPENNYLGQNQPGWCNKEVDGLLKRITQELDEKKRTQMGQLVEEIWAEELPAIPLFFGVEVSVTKKGLQNWKPTGMLQPVSWNAQEWRWK